MSTYPVFLQIPRGIGSQRKRPSRTGFGCHPWRKVSPQWMGLGEDKQGANLASKLSSSTHLRMH